MGTISRISGFSILKMIRLIREELLIVLGTSSSESVLPRMLRKLEIAGCEKSVVGYPNRLFHLTLMVRQFI